MTSTHPETTLNDLLVDLETAWGCTTATLPRTWESLIVGTAVFVTLSSALGEDQARTWMHTPHPHFANGTPADALTRDGIAGLQHLADYLHHLDPGDEPDTREAPGEPAHHGRRAPW